MNSLKPFAVAITAFVAVAIGRADTLEFPQDKPAFTVEVPDGWNPKFSDASTLVIRSEDKNAVVIFGDGLTGVKDDASARQAVAVQAQETAKAAHLTDMKEAKPVKEFKMNKDITAVGAEYNCKSGDNPCVYQAFVFPIGGHYYTAEVNTVESGANESKQARMDLLKSVKPLKKSGDKKDETDDDDSD